LSTCIITGASDGIGKATSIEISKSPDFQNIVIIGRNQQKLLETCKLMNTDKNIMQIIYDLEDIEGIPEMIDGIVSRFHTINCLINVAGYTDPQSLLSMSIDSLKKTYSINVFAPLILTRECVKHMKYNEHGSKILNVASTAGMTPRPGWLSYASSKAALISSSLTLADELAEYNIKVYCISPGRCATALRRKLAPDEDQTKIMQPEEVARVICNLVSSEEACLDGQNIIVRKKTR